MLLLHEMEEDGSTPELESYQAVLEILKDAGQWKQVRAKVEGCLLGATRGLFRVKLVETGE